LGGKIEFAVLAGRKSILRRELTRPPQGDHYRNGKGTGGNATVPISVPRLFLETKGTHTADILGSSAAAP